MGDIMELNKVREKMDNRPVGAIGKRKRFGVLIPLVEIDGEIHMLFEMRSSKIKTQPGDVCVPGGALEDGETIVQCALRETWEEIGIEPSEIEVLGEFDVQHEPERLSLHTVVGILKEESLNHIKINPAEVAEVFTVPVRFFMETEPEIYMTDFVQTAKDFPYEKYGIRRDYKWSEFKREVPVYVYEDHVVWGMTCRILRWFIQEMNK